MKRKWLRRAHALSKAILLRVLRSRFPGRGFLASTRMNGAPQNFDLGGTAYWDHPLDRFQRLERRRVLNADFAILGGQLDLNNFDALTLPDLTISYDGISNEFDFTLSTGTWTDVGVDPGGIVTGSTLSVSDAVLTGPLNIDSLVTTNVAFDGDIASSLDQVTITTVGGIVSDNANTNLSVLGAFSVSGATSIVIGDSATDVIDFGSVTLSADGDIQVSQDSAMLVSAASSSLGGDIMLESVASPPSMSSGLDLTVAGAIASSGNITLRADDDVFINATVTASATGDVYVDAGNATADAMGVNGIDVAASVTSDTGSILLSSQADISTTANLLSTSGDIGLIANNDISQSSDLTTTGDVLVNASNSITMDATSSTSGGDIVYDTTSGDITLGLLSASGDVALDSGGSIMDGNASATNIVAVDLALRSASLIGAPDPLAAVSVNSNAIDIDVTNVAAIGSGIYLQEANGLNLTNVDELIVSVTATCIEPGGVAVSATATSTQSALDDLTATGVIKVVTLAGDLSANDGADGDGLAVESTSAGDILLDARTGDLITSDGGGVSSQGGHITLQANSVSIGDDVSTTGTGTIYVEARSGSITVSDGVDADLDGIRSDSGNILLDAATDITLNAEINSASGDVGLLAAGTIDVNSSVTTGGIVGVEANGNVTQPGNLTGSSVVGIAGGTYSMAGSVNATAGNVVLQSNGDLTLGSITGQNVALSSIAGNILDGNGGGVTNVTANNLSMRATAGSIGAPQPAAIPSVNDNAIDTDIDSIAAAAGNGVYIQEVSGLAVAAVPAISVTALATGVERVNFRSSPRTAIAASSMASANTLSDITSGGVVKVVALAGDLTANDGADGDGLAVESTSAGDILLDARTGDLITSDGGGVSSEGGHITLQANSVSSGDDVSTTGTGTIFVEARSGSITVSDGVDADLDGIRSDSGNILLDAATDITLNAEINSASGDVGLLAAGTIDVNSSVTTGGIVGVEANGNVTQPGNLTGASVVGIAGGTYNMAGSMSATAGNVVLQSSGDLTLGSITGQNVALSSIAGNILDGNGGGVTNVTANNLSMRATAGSIGAQPLLADAIDTNVDVLAMEALGGIYIQELNGLTIGSVPAVSVTVLSAGVEQVNFRSSPRSLNSTSSSLMLGSLDGLTGGDEVKISVDLGNLAIAELVQVTDDLLLDVTGNVTQSATISALGLGLMVDGTTTLTDPANVFTVLSAANGGNTSVTTSSDLTIAPITVAGMTIDDVVASGNIIVTANSIVDGDVSPNDFGPNVDPDIDGDNVVLNANTIGIAGGDFFKGDLNPVEVRAVNDLTANATSIAIDYVAGGIVTLNSTNVALISDGTIHIDDLTVAGDLRIDAADVVANDGTIDLQANRILFVSGQTETINVAGNVGVLPLQLDARTGGDLVVNALTVVDLLDLDCDNVALATTDAGFVGSVLLNGNGDVTVSDDVIAGFDRQLPLANSSAVSTSTGAVTLVSNQNLYVNDAVLTGDGDLRLQAAGDIRFGDTLSGNDNLMLGNNDDLLVASSVNGNVILSTTNAGSEIFMVDTARIVAGRDATTDYMPNFDGLASPSSITLDSASRGAGQAEVSVTSDGDITIGSIQTANATADAIRITSSTGGILDGGDTFTDLVANMDGALVTLRAETGIGHLNALESEIYAVDASNSNSGDICLEEVAAGGDLNVVNADNASNDNIQIRVAAGALTVTNNAFTPSNGLFDVSANGNILLEASEDLIVDNLVQSVAGNITLRAGDDIDVNATVQVAAGTGDLLVSASDGNASDAPVGAVDGINVDGSLLTDQGDILLRSQNDIQTTSSILSALGNVGLVANNDVLQLSDINAGGDVLVSAGNSIVMSNATTTATNIIYETTTADILLDHLVASGIVSLFSGDDILDNNIGVLDPVNITATSASLVAGNFVGAPRPGLPEDQNENAIDTQVDTLAVSAGSGVYIQEADGLEIGFVPELTVAVDAIQLHFHAVDNSDGVTSTHAALSDITSGGVVKLVSDTGDIVVSDGGDLDGLGVESTGAGDILLDARSGDVITLSSTLGPGSDDGGGVSSLGGHITLQGNNVSIGDDVLTTGGGTIFVQSRLGDINVSEGNDADLDGIRSEDGTILLDSAANIIIDAGLVSTQGDIALVSATNVDLNANLTTGGNVGVTAGVDIQQNADVTASGVLIDAGNDYQMSAVTDALTTATSVVAQAGRDVVLNHIVASGEVAISAGGDIVDGNSASLVQEVDISASGLSLRAGGSIGGPRPGLPADENENAIDTQVDVLAAQAGVAVYVEEQDGLSIGDVPGVTITIDAAQQVNFRSSPTTAVTGPTLTLNPLEDITSGGVVKLVSDTGDIVVSDGGDLDGLGVESTSAGDILLDARAGDVITLTSTLGPGSDDGGGVSSQGGHITLQGNNVSIGDDVLTTGGGTIFVQSRLGDISVSEGNDADLDGIRSEDGDIQLESASNLFLSAGGITSTGGDIGLRAVADVVVGADISTAGLVGIDAGATVTQTANTAASNVAISAAASYTMSGGAAITVANDVVILAGTDITLEQIFAPTGIGGGTVAIATTGGSILDGNDGVVNVTSHGLSLRAPNQAIGSLANPLDTEVDVLAAIAANGIFMQEQDAVEIGAVSAVVIPLSSLAIEEVNFRSSPTTPNPYPHGDVALGALSDVTTTASGNILLSTIDGTVTVTDGDDSDGRGVDAAGTGSIEIDANLSGSVLLLSEVRAVDGDILLSAGQNIDENMDGRVAGNNLTLSAGGYAHLHDTHVDTLTATVHSNGTLDPAFQVLNAIANATGDDFVDVLGANLDANVSVGSTSDVQAELLAVRNALAPEFQYILRYGLEYSLFIQNTGDLVVTGVTAGTSANPNVYIETLVDAALPMSSADLSIEGIVSTQSDNLTEGGIVLIAGSQLNLDNAPGADGLLQTTVAGGFQQLLDSVSNLLNGVRNPADTSSPAPTYTQIDAVFAEFYDGGEGNTLAPDQISTRFVIPTASFVDLSSPGENFETHVLQRVALQFGENPALTDQGFITIIGYADGVVEGFTGVQDAGSGIAAHFGGDASSFSVNPQTILGLDVSTLNVRDFVSLNPGAIDSLIDAAAPVIPEFPFSGDTMAPGTTAVFVRSQPFDELFLNSFQMLPTTAIVRRAPDFFVFEDGGRVDLTVETAEIENVQSRGAGFVAVPAPVESPEVQFVEPRVITEVVERPALFISTSIELPVFVQEQGTVSIFKVDYDDLNNNGQVDGNELPTYEQVLQLKEVDSSEEAFEEEVDDQGSMIKVKEIEPATGETPTQDEITREKNALLGKPDQPSGAYAIIQEGADGERTVLDVFSIRDWTEETVESAEDTSAEEAQLEELLPWLKADVEESSEEGSESETPPLPEEVPPPVGDDLGAALLRGSHRDDAVAMAVPGGDRSELLAEAAAGGLFGVLMMRRSPSRASTGGGTGGQIADLSRRARLRRKLQKQLESGDSSAKSHR